MATSPFLDRAPIGMHWKTMDPFLFCAYHLDKYPKANSEFGPDAPLSGRDIGQDFAGKDGWRMYHGEKIPGFPGHPHRGFETVTIVEQGVVDHADSQGAAGRYRDGDVQWMTAGSGIQHSEMFPLLNRQTENTLELFQIWLNLPKKNKMVPPHFSMFWKEEIPVVRLESSSGIFASIKVVAGSLFGMEGLEPPPHSLAHDKESKVGIYLIHLEPNASLTLPQQEKGLHRNLYFYNGHTMKSQGETLASGFQYELDPTQTVHLQNGDTVAKFLLLEGRPLREPVVQYGPFVMNSPQEIQQAFSDYQKTQFGGWPWDSYDPLHTGKERFARFADGTLAHPSQAEK